MGADGGVCWLRMENPASIEEVRRLLLPWLEALTNVEVGMDFSTESRFDWIDEHRAMLVNCMIGPYGTDLYHTSLTWETLGEWVRFVEWVCGDSRYDKDWGRDAALEASRRGLSPDSTWGDFLLERETRSSNQQYTWGFVDDYGSSKDWLLALREPYWRRPVEQANAFLSLKIGNWSLGIRKIFGNNFNSGGEETWT